MNNDINKHRNADVISALRARFAKEARDLHQEAAAAKLKFEQTSWHAKLAQDKADAMDAALAALKDQSQATSTRLSAIANEKTIYLVDGSGSMSGVRLTSTLNVLAAQGAKNLIFFGNKTPVVVDLADRAKYEKGLMCGTEIMPSLQALSATLLDGKKRNLVIVTDGDVAQQEAEHTHFFLSKMLARNPQLVVSIGVLATYPTSFDKIVTNLQAVGATRIRTAKANPNDQDSIAKAIAKLSTYPRAAKKAATPKQGG